MTYIFQNSVSTYIAIAIDNYYKVHTYLHQGGIHYSSDFAEIVVVSQVRNGRQLCISAHYMYMYMIHIVM